MTHAARYARSARKRAQRAQARNLVNNLLDVNRMHIEKEELTKYLTQIVEILRPLNINLNAPALTPIEIAYFHITSLIMRLNIDEVTIRR